MQILSNTQILNSKVNRVLFQLLYYCFTIVYYHEYNIRCHILELVNTKIIG